MNTTYVNNIPLTHGEVSVIMSDSVTESAKHAASLAREIQSHGVNVLVLNCAMSDQRFRYIADPIINGSAGVPPASRGRQADEDAGETPALRHGAGGTPALRNKKTYLEIRSCVRGNLVNESDKIDYLISECRIGVIILCGWEWTSSSWRRKERLLYYLREIMEEHGVAVMVYSTARTQPTVGQYDRGGLGKLAELAMYITRLDAAEALKEKVKKPKPIVVRNQAEAAAAERSAQLIAEKLKSYEGQNSPGRTDTPLISSTNTPLISSTNTPLISRTNTPVRPSEQHGELPEVGQECPTHYQEAA